MTECMEPACQRKAAYLRTKFGLPLCAPCYQRRNRELLGALSPDDRALFIYFVQSHDGYIKIGRASDVERRIGSLQTAQALPLRTLLILSGSSDTEFALHARFAHLRVRDDGEWFVPGRELLEFIADPQMPISTLPEESSSQLQLGL